MADKKISELDSAIQINNDAVFPMSQDNSGEPTSFKTAITQLGTKIAEGLTLSNLQTQNKNLVGAINELLSLGNPIILGTSAPTSSQGANGNLYIQYTAGTGGADDEVDGIYVKINGAWCEIQTGGGGGAGGHTIVDDAGTSLTQRTNLQFNGAYSEDNSTDDTTEINVVRSMTRAEFNQLSAQEKTGLINITDETSQIYATEIPITSGSATDTKSYIDNSINAPIKSSEVVSIPNSALSVGSNWGEGCFYVKRNGLIILHLALQGLTANTRNDVYTLPTGCRPSLQIVGAGMGGNSYTAFAQATITTGGVVQVSSVDTYARIHLMYYVNE